MFTGFGEMQIPRMSIFKVSKVVVKLRVQQVLPDVVERREA